MARGRVLVWDPRPLVAPETSSRAVPKSRGSGRAVVGSVRLGP